MMATTTMKQVVIIDQFLLGTLEARRDVLAASVDEQAEGNGDVEVDPENVGLNGGAEANGCFEI